MKKLLIIVLASVLLCILSISAAIVTELFVFNYLHEWVREFSGKFLTYDFTLFDKLLYRFYPLLIGVFFAIYHRHIAIKRLINIILLVIPSIMFLLIVGILIGVFTWSSSENSLLPSYLLIQPYSFYWTSFIIVAIITPVWFSLRKKLPIQKNEELLD